MWRMDMGPLFNLNIYSDMIGTKSNILQTWYYVQGMTLQAYEIRIMWIVANMWK